MRQAAGIILIILGIFVLIGLINLIIGWSHFTSHHPLSVILLRIVYVAFCVTGGIFCLRKTHWRVCLASASFAVSFGIFAVVYMLLRGHFFLTWDTWILVIGAVISTIFISLTKKEWQKS